MTATSPPITLVAGNYIPIRQDWLDRRKSRSSSPNCRLSIPHHHLWDRPGWRYLLDDLLRDTDSGHNIVATVFVQARAMSRRGRARGDAARRRDRVRQRRRRHERERHLRQDQDCAGIVGHADLTVGSRVEPVLAAHIRAGGERFRGIRHITAWDAEASVRNPAYSPPPGLLGDKTFREGSAVLGRLGLSFDAWLYHPQIDELTDLARAFPETTIVLDHVGRPDRDRAAYAGKHKEISRLGRVDQGARAVPMSTSSSAGSACGSAASASTSISKPPSSETLATAWRPYIETCIEAFGPSRCNVREQFPGRQGLLQLSGVLERLQAPDARRKPRRRRILFAGTAARFYRLEL